MEKNGDGVHVTIKKTVGIIGAGVSGLAAAKAFSAQGHAVIGFERSDTFGGVWAPNRSYPGVKTQSPKDLYRFTDLPMPESYPEWPSGNQVLSYLESYAEKHGLVNLFRFGTRVLSINERIDGKPGWTLNLSCSPRDKNGKQKNYTYTLDFDFIVVCSGTLTDPKTILHPGQNDFTEGGGGQVMHSSEYKNVSNDMKDRRVVVIGGSKSATDIAVHAAEKGAQQVTLLYRRNIWRVPPFIAGINVKHVFFMRALEVQFNGWTGGGGGGSKSKKSSASRIVSIISKPLIWAHFRALEALVSLQLGLKKWGMVPKERIEDYVSCEIPLVTEGLFEGFQSGSIKPVNTTLERYVSYGDEVMDALDTKNSANGTTDHAKNKKRMHVVLLLGNGETLEADTVIQATGWTLNLPYLPQRLQDKLVDDKDGLYRLYRFAVNPKLPNIGFVGFNSSFCSVLGSEMIANWLVRYADGMLVAGRVPSLEKMEDEIEHLLDWKRKERPAAMVYGGNCVAPFHNLHFDEIFDDMGSTLKYGSMFSYPDADKFGECLDSLLKYSTY